MQTNRSTFGILFYLNTSKKKKSGKCPIVGRISVDGKSTAFSTSLDILPEQWNAQSGTAIGKQKKLIVSTANRSYKPKSPIIIKIW